MSNLLKKASIITTPTAYDDGRILSVKPNENLYGSEEIVNGDFATNSDWTVGSTWTISGGSANCNGTTSNLDQTSLATNTKYKITITVSNITTGTLAVRLGSSNADVLSLTKNGTYTGYGLSNGEVFRLRSQSGFDGSVDNVSVVEDLSGDFNFERGSAATRVNAQGLVENVQILSSELVQNGNFSEIGSEEVSNGDFSQEGSELVSGNNSNFDTSTGDWQQFRGVLSWDSSIKAGKWTDNGNSGSPKGFTMSGGVIPTSSGKIYRVKFVAKTDSSSSFNFEYIGESSTFNTISNPDLTSDFQDYEFTFTASGNNQRLYIALNGFPIGNGESYWIDNVSVKEVGQDWTLGTGWSVGSNLINATSTSSVCYQDIASMQSNKSYKVTYQISNYSGGNIQWRFGGTSTVDGATRNANGIYTEYFTNTSSGDKRFFLSPSGFSGSITNISVKEVGQDWTLGTGWSIDQANSKAKSIQTSSNNYIQQTISTLSNNKLYRVTFDLDIISSTTTTIGISNTGAFGNLSGSVRFFTTSGTKTFDGLYSDAYPNYIRFVGGIGTEFTITNVSIVEVTDDTDLPRINYEGFSYQDVLGSELITNGDFAVDGSWVKGTGWTISGGSANGSSTTGDLYQENVVESGKYYKVTYTISNYVSGSVRVELSSNAYAGIERSANGTYTETILSGSTTVLFDARTSFTGSIDNVSVKEYLGQEVVPNSGCGSWLFEPQSTNLYPYSEDFTQWDKVGTTVIENAIISPNGSLNSDKIEETAGGAYHNVNEDFGTLSSGSTYTASAFYKSAERTSATIYESLSTGGYNLTSFNLTNGTVISEDAAHTATIKDYGNGWYKCSITFTLNASRSGSIFYGTNDALNFIGVSGNGVYIWGAQLEQLSYATSYIPTNGAASTRLQDIANNSGNSDLISSTEGVLYAEISALANDVTNRYITLSDGTSNNRLIMRYANGGNNLLNVQSRVGGVIQANLSKTLSDITVSSKVAFKYKENDFALWVNGFEVGTDTSGSVSSANTLNKLNFSDAGGGVPFYGKNKALAVWKEALTDTELELLTAPAPEFPTFSLDFDTIAEQFTFTRGSEATFVNEQGLIQSTNELGEEEVVNGDFATDSDWSKTQATISNGEANITSPDGSYAAIYQSGVVTSGKTYYYSVNVKSISGTMQFVAGSGTNIDVTTIGIKKGYITANGTSIFEIKRKAGAGVFSATIDNVSVKEVITATNTPRIDYLQQSNYSTGVEAFLLEPQSTNLITYSEDFSNSSWVKTGVGTASTPSVTSNYSISPDGTQNADRVVFDLNGGTANGDVSQVSVSFGSVSSASYTNSVYIKSNTTNDYDLVVTDPSGTAIVKTITSQWQRFDNARTSVTNLSIRIRLRGDESTSDYADVSIWGAQLEQLAYATSYIPTDGASATRNQETCVDATPTINSEEGVLYAEISTLADDGTLRQISLSDGSYNNTMMLRYLDLTNKVQGAFRVGGVFKGSCTVTLSSSANFIKIAYKYKNSDFALWVNGFEVATSTDSFSISANTLNKLSFDRGDGIQNFYGSTKDLQVFDKALSDYQLKQLTTI